MTAYSLWVLAAAAGLAQAAVTPTAPGPGQSFDEGSKCKIEWSLDTTGTWTNVSIDLMTGSNLAMVVVENVVSGLDGTTGNGTYEWTCPTVTPNSDIYFYQFTNNGQDPTWTTRFTIASADGSTTNPTNSTAESSTTISWGTGHLVTGSGASSAASTGSSPSHTSSAVAAEATGSSGSSDSSGSSGSSSNASATTPSSTTSSTSSSNGTGTSTTSGAAGEQARLWVASVAVAASLGALVL